MASSLVGGGEGAAQPMEAERGTRAPGEESPSKKGRVGDPEQALTLSMLRAVLRGTGSISPRA